MGDPAVERLLHRARPDGDCRNARDVRRAESPSSSKTREDVKTQVLTYSTSTITSPSGGKVASRRRRHINVSRSKRDRSAVARRDDVDRRNTAMFSGARAHS